MHFMTQSNSAFKTSRLVITDEDNMVVVVVEIELVVAVAVIELVVAVVEIELLVAADINPVMGANFLAEATFFSCFLPLLWLIRAPSPMAANSIFFLQAEQ
jgi:hypothetical protein